MTYQVRRRTWNPQPLSYWTAVGEAFDAHFFGDDIPPVVHRTHTQPTGVQPTPALPSAGVGISSPVVATSPSSR